MQLGSRLKQTALGYILDLCYRMGLEQHPQ